MRVVIFGQSPNRVAAKGFPFTGLAVFAYPDGIELVHGLLNQFRVVGEDACLEVACAIAFHADACASEVGAADVGNLVIEDQNLEMHPWTKCPFKAIKQSRVFVEVLAERRTWLLGMDKPHLNTFFDELCQDRKEGLRLRPDLDVQVFNVGGANPKASLDRGHPAKHFVVMVATKDKLSCHLINVVEFVNVAFLIQQVGALRH